MLAGLACTSCQDILEENPDSYYQRKDFFVNVSNAELAVMGIYNVLPTIYGDKDGMALPCSDDTYYVNGTTSDNTRRDIAHYVLKPSNTWIYNVWKGKYEGLNRANYTIDGIEGMECYQDDTTLKNWQERPSSCGHRLLSTWFVIGGMYLSRQLTRIVMK